MGIIMEAIMSDVERKFAAFQITEDVLERQKHLQDLDHLFHADMIPICFQTMVQTGETTTVEKEEVHYVELV